MIDVPKKGRRGKILRMARDRGEVVRCHDVCRLLEPFTPAPFCRWGYQHGSGAPV